MIRERCFAFTDEHCEGTNLQALDCLLCNPTTSAITFIRDKKHLIFFVSPNKDAFRIVSCIKSERDFSELGQLLSELNGLSGCLGLNPAFLLWQFNNSEKVAINIKPKDYAIFDAENSLLKIHRPGTKKELLSIKASLIQSEYDFYEIANLIAAMNESMIREEYLGESTLALEFIPR